MPQLVPAETYGWEIADPQAYPLPLVYLPDQTTLRPTAEQLQWFESVAPCGSPSVLVCPADFQDMARSAAGNGNLG